MTIDTPAAGARVGDTLTATAHVTSPYSITSVSAALDTVSTPMTTTASGWIGTLDLSALPSGTKSLTVSALNALGTTTTSTITVILDRPPTPFLGVDPLAWEVVRSSTIHATASCVDDVRCDSLQVQATADGATYTVLASGTTSIDTDVSLAAFEGKQVTLRVVATDNGGLTAALDRGPIFVDSSTTISEVVRTPGRVIDVTSKGVLWIGPDDVVRLRDGWTGADTAVATAPSMDVASGWVTPTGALVTFPAAPGIEVVELSHGVVIDRGISYGAAANGNYATWAPASSSTAEVFFRDFAADTVIDTGQSGSPLGVTATGEVIYMPPAGTSPGCDVVDGWRGGVVTSLPVGGCQMDGFITDGTTTVSSGHVKFFNNCSIYVDDASGSTLLAGNSSCTWRYTAGVDYGLANGWVAYRTYAPDGSKQVYLRSPTGTTSMVSVFSTESVLDAISPCGEVTTTSAGRRYLRAVGGLPVDVSSDLGHGHWTEGAWYVVMGGSVFAVAAPTGSSCSGDVDAGPPGDGGIDADAGSADTAVDAADTALDATVDAGPDAPTDLGATSDTASPLDAPSTDSSTADAVVADAFDAGRDGATSDASPDVAPADVAADVSRDAAADGLVDASAPTDTNPASDDAGSGGGASCASSGHGSGATSAWATVLVLSVLGWSRRRRRAGTAVR